MPRKRPPGRKPHPIDVHLAEQIRNTPNTWHIYPTAERWPDEPNDLDHLRRQHSRLSARLNGKFGPFAHTNDGRFHVRIRTDQQRIFITYRPTETNQ